MDLFWELEIYKYIHYNVILLVHNVLDQNKINVDHVDMVLS